VGIKGLYFSLSKKLVIAFLLLSFFYALSGFFVNLNVDKIISLSDSVIPINSDLVLLQSIYVSVGELRTNVDKYSLAGFSQYKEDIDSNLSSIKEKINLIGSKEMVGFLEGLTSLESNTLEIEKAFVSYDSSDKNEFFVE
jgi:hypothetical protein